MSPPGMEFAALAEVAKTIRAIRRDLTQLATTTAGAARQARAIRAWSSQLPLLEIDLADDVPAQLIRDGLTTNQPWPFRFRAVAVLALPDTFERYLRGRSRQAVRTNRHHAADMGLSVVRPDSSDEAKKLCGVLLAEHEMYESVDDLVDEVIARGHIHPWFVLDSSGSAVAFAAVAIDRHTAQLQTLQVALDAHDRSAARYLLSTEIIRALIEDSVEYLLADSMLFSSPGVVYLEQRLGFEPMNVVLRGGRRRARRGPKGRTRLRRPGTNADPSR